MPKEYFHLFNIFYIMLTNLYFLPVFILTQFQDEDTFRF